MTILKLYKKRFELAHWDYKVKTPTNKLAYNNNEKLQLVCELKTDTISRGE